MLFKEFGHRKPGRIAGSAWLMNFFSDSGDRERWHIRHLPRPRNRGARILDVGCGNGSFLRAAEELGYSGWGLEPDPLAVEVARSAGFNVICGTLPGSSFEGGSFEHVTCSHVIEHMHYPVAALHEIYSLLSPGGRVWITTPNLESIGHAIFKKNWRGLESPRHVCLYTQDSLTRLLSDTGFVEVNCFPTLPEASSYFSRSVSIANSKSESGMAPFSVGELDQLIAKADADSSRLSRNGESLLVMGFKPLS
jgi:SAM-dependent methyltransferase